MSLFNNKVNTILEKTRLNANELCPGDFICNTNPECKHFKSKGIVLKVKPMEDETGVIGNLVRYIVLNDGPTYKKGDCLDKTEIQLDKPSDEDEERSATLLNTVQSALDVAGLEPTVGTAADAANTIISSLRAAIAKEPDIRKKHLINAGISAVSMLPFGDIAKLAKARKIRKPLTKGLKIAKSQIKKQKSPFKNRFNEQLNPKPNIKPDPKQLAMGIKVEMEHTDDKKVAKTIALQHLAEDPIYYSKLKKIHK